MTKLTQKKSSVISTPVDGSLDFAQLGVTQTGGVTRLFTGNVGGATNTPLVLNAEQLTALLQRTASTGGFYKALVSLNGTYINAVLVNNEVGAPTVNNDITQGYIPGSLYVDQNTNTLYSAVDTGEGAAVWVQVSSNLTNPVVFKGVIDCSTNPNYPASDGGWLYVVSVAGKIGGASGVIVEIGDQILCLATNGGGTQASVGSSFSVLQTNINNAVTSSSVTSTDSTVALFDGTSGKVIKDSAKTISDTASLNTIVARNEYGYVEYAGVNQMSKIVTNGAPYSNVLTLTDPSYVRIIEGTTPDTNTLTLPDADNSLTYGREYIIVNECLTSGTETNIQYQKGVVYPGVGTLLAGQMMIVTNNNGLYDAPQIINLDQRFSVNSTANTIPVRDANRRVKANGIINEVTTTTTPTPEAVFLFLTNADNRYQELKNEQGGEGDGVAMPDATTLPLGDVWTIFNNSDGSLEIYPYDNPPSPIVLYTIGTTQVIQLILVDNTTPSGVWKVILNSDSVIDGGTF